MKKLTFKRVTATVLSVLGLTALGAGLTGCLTKSSDIKEPDNIEITKTPPPDDGSLPTAHSCAENLAYINYVFDNQEQYHSYSYGVTNAAIATQTTRTFRDYKDGVLLTTDLTYSSMIKNGSQTCTVINDEGEPEVYFRVCEAPKENTVPTTAVWSEAAPVIFNEKSYHYSYGLLPTSLFNYIVNEENITDSEEVKKNSDGTYTLKFLLDPQASTYFYQFGMKTRGGLSDYPEFISIDFTVNFDANWQILDSALHEVSKVNKGVIVDSISDFRIEYSYGEANFDAEHYAFYENYYKQYLGDQTLESGGGTDEKLVLDVTSMLSNGFAQVMNGGAQYEISLNLGNNAYTGYVFLSLDLADPLGTLALKASLGKSLKNQSLYVEYNSDGLAAYYGKDFALSANMTEVKLAVDKFGELIDKIKAAFGGGSGDVTAPVEKPSENYTDNSDNDEKDVEETPDALTELMNCMVLDAGEKQAVLTLDTDDLLGLGIGVYVRLVFGINNNDIIFRGGSVHELSIGGEPLDLSLNIRTTTAPIISRENVEASVDLAEYVADVYSLLSSDLIKVNLKLDGNDEKVKIAALKGVYADVDAFVDLDGATVGAEATVSYTYGGSTLTARIGARYLYDKEKGGYGEAIVRLSELNGAKYDLKLYCDIKQIADAVIALLTTAGATPSAATDGVAAIINGALASDFSSVLTELYADKTNIKIGVSVDAVLKMINLNAGVDFGSCTLVYERGAENGGTLSAELPAIGFALEVRGADGELEAVNKDGALDLSYALDDVLNLINSELIKLDIELNGSATGVTISQLNGIYASLTAYISLDGFALGADAEISYALGDVKVSANMSLRYIPDEGGNGASLAVCLTAINGVPVNMKVGCKVDELKEAVIALLSYAGVTQTPFDGGLSLDLSEILTDILGADFSELLPELKSDEASLNASLNVDALLEILGLNVNLNIGNAKLLYDHGADDKLVLGMPALGLSLKLGGATGEVTLPDMAGSLDLAKLVKTVQSAWEQVDGIIEAEKLAFTIPGGAQGAPLGSTYLSLDGIIVDIWGDGEISWEKDNEYVVLDLSFAITERATDVATFRLIYDKNAIDTPLVRLALNEVGIDIYKSDIESVKSGFETIYNKVKGLIGGDTAKTADEAPKSATVADEKPASENRLMAVVFEILTSSDWVDLLNRLTLSCDGKSIALEVMGGEASEIRIGADGCLSLEYDAAIGSRFSLAGEIQVTNRAGALADKVNEKLKTAKISSTKKEGAAGFIRLAYDFLFEGLSGLSVENILGTKTYTVEFKLDGKNTTVKALKDIDIYALVLVTGANGSQPKLAEGTLKINANGVVIDLNVISERQNGETYFYINLNRVMDVYLPDLKFVATQSSLYDTISTVVGALTETDVLDMIGALLPKADENTATEPNDNAQGAVSDESIDVIAKIVEGILNLDFNLLYDIEEIEDSDTVTARLYPDVLLKQLGFDIGSLGTIVAEINHGTHAMTTVGTTQMQEGGKTVEKVWISLSSMLADTRDYSSFDRSSYVSIEFLPDLLKDLVKFATDDSGKLYNSFTLSGQIKADISIIHLTIDVCNLTVGFDENGIVLSGVLHISSLNVLIASIPSSTVGITYRNGLITLARGISGNNPEYKVMTLEYFLDHMLTKQNSVLEWWLNISGWSTILNILDMANLDLSIDSGLTKPEQIYLYKQIAEGSQESIFMYDYVKAIRVVIDGKRTADFGNFDGVEKNYGIYDNYYGFSLNGEKIIGGVMKDLYAVITRNEEGIDRILAYANILGIVDLNIDLQYNEGLEEEFEIGTTLTNGVKAPDFYQKAVDVKDAAGYSVDFDYFARNPDNAGYDVQFGCLAINWDSKNNSYSFATEYSNILYTHTLTIVGLDGKTEERLVRNGSTIYFYDNASPVFTDDSQEFRLMYTTTQGVLGEKTAMFNADMTVYAIKVKSVVVNYYSGKDKLLVKTIYSYAGDKLSSSVEGLETVGAATYADGNPVVDGTVIVSGVSEINIYGTFVKTVEEIDGVVYTYDRDTGSYIASGKGADFAALYADTGTTKGKTLVIAESINGYKVTAIGEQAFANLDDKPIKNVIIPASVTKIGKNAFLNNYGMESVVILADEVTMLGTSGVNDNENIDQPFYGCSAEKDGNTTKLEIYYNRVNFNGSYTDTTWTKFRVKEASWLIYDRYYIGNKPSGGNGDDINGGGALHTSGWSFVELNVTGAEIVSESNVSFVNEVANRVPLGLNLSGTYTQADGDKLASELVGLLSSYKNALGDDKYIVNVGVVASGAYVKVNVSVSLNLPVEVSVYSEIPFVYTMSGKAQTVEAGQITQINVVKNGKNVELYTPVASVSGYVFLGWASENDGKLEFVGKLTEYVEGKVYVAVWGYSKIGVAFNATVHYSGTELVNPSSAATDGKWYDGNWNEVVEISSANTVLYTNSKVVVNVTVSGSGYNNFYKNGTREVKAKSSYEFTVDVWEKDGVRFTFTDSNKTVNIGGDAYTANKTGATGLMNNGARTFSLSQLNGLSLDGDYVRLISSVASIVITF